MARQVSGPEAFLPLTANEFEILLALFDAERHGYAILQEVEQRTEGRVLLRPGTLYRALQRMLDAGLVIESQERGDPELDDERRRYYGLTELGRRVAVSEAQRLDFLVRSARAKKLLHPEEA